MEEICKELKESYNTNLLSKLSIEEQAIFYREAKIHKSDREANYTLMKLIENKYKKVSPEIYKKLNPKYIGGPFSLSLQWNPEKNMMVYIFGEFHSIQMDCFKTMNDNDFINVLKENCPKNTIYNTKKLSCVHKNSKIGKEIINNAKKDHHIIQKVVENSSIPIEDFFETLLEHTTSFIDFYLEIPAYSGEEYTNKNNIVDQRIKRIADRLLTCVEKISRSNPKCDLARVHYMDVRKPAEIEVNSLSYFRDKAKLVFNVSTDSKDQFLFLKNLLDTDERFERTLRFLKNKNQDGFISFIQRQLRASPIVSKETKRCAIDNEIVLNYLYPIITSEALKYRGIFIENINFILDNYKIIEATDLKKQFILYKILRLFRETYDMTVTINSKVVDVYTICRIFKKFKNPINQPESPHNIIIYAGDAHSSLYRNFLLQNDFITLAQTKNVNCNTWQYTLPKVNDSQNCVDVRNFPKPFFDNKFMKT
tara:strand:+ start:4694 stop:6133 length:1440 start_codon:yes stop_codon:yes gene_type:complete